MFVDFLNRYRAKSTRALYVSAWVKFLSLVYSARLAGATPEVLAPWAAKYVNDLRNGRRDLDADLRILGDRVPNPKTSQTYQSAIRTFLATAGLPRQPETWRLPSRGPGRPPPPPAGEPLAAGMLLRILEHLDTRGRAILYVLASSGAGPGEVLSFRPEDLDLESRPARFLVRDREGAVSRVAFISREAVGAIRVYLIVRDRYVASARSRGGAGSGDLLFPLGPRAFGEVWGLAVEKAGLGRADPVTGRRTITPRATRRFFADRMGTVLPAPVVGELLGRPGNLAGRGRLYTDEELGRAYLEGERAVTLHRSQRKEQMARKIADLEKLVHLLREEGRERDRELARIGAILSAGTRGGQGWPEREVEGP
jgi:integrase